ncbi:LPS assembly lipoprotein LptE [Candidatus Omnitrophota bacterium]
MRKNPKRHYLISTAAVCLMCFLAGCGYTTRSLLPSKYRSICVENFANKIDISGETSDLRMYRGYRPGLEAEITEAVTEKFIFDGNLKITDREGADLLLTGELLDFAREGILYDRNDEVEEYRVRLIVDIELKNARDDTLVWRERNFAGESTYRTTGSLAKTEDAGVQEARDDLARRIVERVVEGW